MRMDLFDDESDSSYDEEFSIIKNKHKLKNQNTLHHVEEEKLQLNYDEGNKNNMTFNISDEKGKNHELGNMIGEDSYSPSASESNSSKDSRSKKSQHGSEESNSLEDSSKSSSSPKNDHLPIKNVQMQKYKPQSKTAYIGNIKLNTKKANKNHLNLSRGTIKEVDEEQMSDTTNRKSSCISLVFGNLMASSDHKSTRRFHKISGTLKGNSPNTSMNIHQKDLSDMSNPYIDRVDSANSNPNIEKNKDINFEYFITKNENEDNILSPNHVYSRSLVKKKSTKNIRVKLSNEYKQVLKSDRSARYRAQIDNIKLSVDEFKPTGSKEELIKHARSGDIKNSVNIVDFGEEEVKFTNSPSVKKSTFREKPEENVENENLPEYIRSVDSPVSTNEGFDFKKSENSSDQSSLEDIDDDLNLTNPSMLEEEKKLSFYASVSEISHDDDEFYNQKTKELMTSEDTNSPSKMSKNYDKKSGHKNDSTTYKTNINGNSKIIPSSFRLRRSENKMIDVKSLKIFGSDSYFQIENSETAPTGGALEFEAPIYNENVKQSYEERIQKDLERQELIKSLKKKMVNYQNSNAPNQNADQLFRDLQNKLMLISKYPKVKDSTKRLIVNKADFKYTSLKDIIATKNEDIIVKKDTIWQRIWKDGDARQFEKKFKYTPQDDINILVNVPSQNSNNLTNDEAQETEYVSRNHLLQEKYNENFISNVISTNTVSIVLTDLKAVQFDRAQWGEGNDIGLGNQQDFNGGLLIDDSDLSSKSEGSKIKLNQSDKDNPVDSFEDSLNKEEIKVNQKDVQKMIVNEITKRLKLKMPNTPTSRTNISGTTMGLSKKATPTRLVSNDTKDKFPKLPMMKSAKMGSRILRRQGTIFEKKFNKDKRIESAKKRNPLAIKRSRSNNYGSLNNQIRRPNSKISKTLEQNEEFFSNRLKAVADHEKESDCSWESYCDEYLDENFNLEDAIKRTKNHEKKSKVVTGEWSGQDIMALLEPYKVSIITSDLSNIKVYRKGIISPIYKIREYLESFILSAFFENVMTLCVTLNTIILAIDHYGIDKNLESDLNNLNLGFTIVF